MYSAALILPALNEGEALNNLLKKLPDEVCGIQLQVYVVDGGSEDNTCKVVKQSEATFIEQTYNGGKGAAMREALEKLDNDVYIFMDADMTYKPSELEKLVKPLKNDEASHVIGSRLNDDMDENAFDNSNLIGNKMLGWFYRRLTGSDIRDFLTGYRALDSDLADKIDLNSKGFEIETELTFKTLQKKEKIKEVDITYGSRVGESKLDFKKEGIRIPWYGFKLAAKNRFKQLTNVLN